MIDDGYGKEDIEPNLFCSLLVDLLNACCLQGWFWEAKQGSSPHWLLMSGAVFASIVSVLLAAFWPTSTEPPVQGLALGGFAWWIPLALSYSLVCWVIQDAVKVNETLGVTCHLPTFCYNLYFMKPRLHNALSILGCLSQVVMYNLLSPAGDSSPAKVTPAKVPSTKAG
jgi:hypothetical protein